MVYNSNIKKCQRGGFYDCIVNAGETNLELLMCRVAPLPTKRGSL